MSLRARLLLGLLVVATLGMVALGGITYAEQRSFLIDRVDRQAQDAVRFANHPRPLGSAARPLPDGDGGPGDRADGEADGDAAGGPDGPGTWLYARTPSGRVVGTVSLSRYPLSATAPRLPADLPAGEPVSIKPSGSSMRYRVLAEPAASGSGTVVAAVPLQEVDQTLHRLLAVEALVIAAVLAALAALAWWVVRVSLRPLDRMGATAGAIAAGDLARRVAPATPRTEVGRLGLALNRMLERLEVAFAERQASEERLRWFLADASHELRTPLSSIRGYAELFRIGAARDEENVEKAMSRIEAEAARMGVLVEDLLTLARLDEVRDVLREPADLGGLAADAVDDARATAPDRDIDVRTAGATTVHGDPHQLRQLLANLLRNALVHTPAGTPVEVTVAGDGEAVTVEVRDHGPGLPDGAGDELFERFWRAEEGRARGKAGAGLGLAIVAGIVHAHGGEVHAGDAPGGGARFLVRLPAAGGAGPRGAAAAPATTVPERVPAPEA